MSMRTERLGALAVVHRAARCGRAARCASRGRRPPCRDWSAESGGLVGDETPGRYRGFRASDLGLPRPAASARSVARPAGSTPWISRPTSRPT